MKNGKEYEREYDEMRGNIITFDFGYCVEESGGEQRNGR